MIASIPLLIKVLQIFIRCSFFNTNNFLNKIFNYIQIFLCDKNLSDLLWTFKYQNIAEYNTKKPYALE